MSGEGFDNRPGGEAVDGRGGLGRPGDAVEQSVEHGRDIGATDDPMATADMASSDGMEIRAVEDGEPALPKKKPNWARRFAIVGFLAWTVTAIAVGVSIGTRQRIEPPPPPPDIAVSVERVEIPEAPPGDDSGQQLAIVPNVLGLTPNEAQAALADAGAAGGIDVVEVSVAGEPGFVVSQSPAPGAEAFGPVTLSVSAAVEVPAVVGSSFADAQATLEGLGAQVRVRTEYQDGAPPDQVLAVTPDAGPLPLEVDLVVAAPPAQLNLDQLDPVEESCSRDAGFGVAGDPQDGSVWICEIERSDSYRSISWDLSRDVSRLAFTAGVTDNGDVAANALVDVVLDGAAVETQPTSFGTPALFDVDTAGALRLEIRVRTDVPDETYDEWRRSWVAVFDLVATGSSDALDELAGLNS